MSATPPFLADRFALILDGLGRVVAARMAERPADRPTLMLLWSYLQRRIRQFAMLAERVRSGKPQRPRTTAPSARRRAPRVQGPRLPSRFAWVAIAVPGAASCGSQLQALLAEPEMQSLLDAAPQAGRMVRPLLQMLGAPIPCLGPLASRPPAARAAPAVNRSPDPAAPSRPPPSRGMRRLLGGSIRLGSFLLLVPG